MQNYKSICVVVRCMQNYKSIRVVVMVMVCAILVNTQKKRQTAFDSLYY